MNRYRGPVVGGRTMARRLPGHGSGSYWRVVLVLLVLAGLIAPGSTGPARAQPRQTAVAPPQLVLSPTSGLAGSTVSLSGGAYPRLADTAPAPITFDGAAMGTTNVGVCSVAGGLPPYGFGTLCTGTAVNLVVPSGAAPGPHTITVTGMDSSGAVVGAASATFTVLPPPTPPSMILDPTSGQAGSTTSVSVINLPNTTAGQSAALTFDSTALGAVPVQQCTAGSPAPGTFGFGAACTGNALFEQIPQAAQPGPHTITASVPAPGSPAGPIGVSAAYTVLAPQATDTATATATATATPVPATGTATNTPPPAATATSTATATATATSTPSSTPIPRSHLVLIKPAFADDSVLIALSADPGAPVHITVRIVTIHDGATTTRYSQSFTTAANASGLCGTTTHLKFHKHLRGRADVTISTTIGGQIVKVSRSFAYSLSG